MPNETEREAEIQEEIQLLNDRVEKVVLRSANLFGVFGDVLRHTDECEEEDKKEEERKSKLGSELQTLRLEIERMQDNLGELQDRCEL